MQDRIDESDESRSTSPAVAQKLKQKSHYYTQSSECEAKKKKKCKRGGRLRRQCATSILFIIYQENSVFFFLFKHVFNLQVNFFSTCPLLLLLFNSNISAIIFSFPSKKKNRRSLNLPLNISLTLRRYFVVRVIFFFLRSVSRRKKKKRKKKSETARAWPFYFQL